MKNYLLIASFFLLTLKGLAQNSFGLEFGTYYEAYNGINDFDSIRVVTTNSDYGEMFGGIFYEFDLKKRLTLHSKLLIRPIYADNVVFKFKGQCCFVRKGSLTPVTNLSLEILPQFKIVQVWFITNEAFWWSKHQLQFWLKAT